MKILEEPDSSPREHVPAASPEPNFVKPVFEECALCASTADLQTSHIIPGFVFAWVRETSATGYFRWSQHPNLRAQDGLKVRMLCRSCEQLFSSWEKPFAERCFAHLNSGDVGNISYEAWMLKFATSVSWRVLRFFAASDGLVGFPDHIMTEVDHAQREWSRFLSGDAPHPGRHEQHMIVVDVIEDMAAADAPPNISRYLVRSTDLDVVHNGESAFTYAKMGRFLLFGFITMKHSHRWKGTKLRVRRGLFGQRRVVLPADIKDYLFGCARRMANSYSKISERQRGKIHKSFEKDLDRAVHSETFRAMHADVSLFGSRAFEVTQPGTREENREQDK